ncbi:MAG: Helix-hairpin-helix DNA-binding class 1 [Chlorobi bacterium]|nr:Helix-hairpin-helix DNA-binding class 1 [Chlorobiota bacterium]
MVTTNLLNRSHWIKGFTLLLHIVLAPCLRAQTAMLASPPETALAGSAVARVESPWFARINPAAVGETRAGALAASFAPSSIGIAGYREGALVMVLPIDTIWHVAATAAFTGVPGYGEMEGSMIAACNPAPQVTIAVGVGLYSLRIRDYGSAMAPTIDLGATARLSEQIRFGCAMRNLARARIAGTDIPQRVGFGFAFEVEGGTILSVDASDELRRSAAVSLAISTSPLAGLVIRGGIGNGPGMISFGMGYHLNDITLDYGGAYGSPLGFRHVVGAGMRF